MNNAEAECNLRNRAPFIADDFGYVGTSKRNRSFVGTRMCFVPHENCGKVCDDYLECPKYQRDESNYDGGKK
jgi:hypothetical protein